MALDPATITLIARLGTELITELIRAGRGQDAEAVREILGRAGVNFDELIAWADGTVPRPTAIDPGGQVVSSPAGGNDWNRIDQMAVWLSQLLGVSRAEATAGDLSTHVAAALAARGSA